MHFFPNVFPMFQIAGRRVTDRSVEFKGSELLDPINLDIGGGLKRGRGEEDEEE